MNNKILKNFALKPLLCGLCGFSFTFSTCVSAEPLTLSDAPLQATGKVEPNLMILMDSSGSMAYYLDQDIAAVNPADSRLYIAKEAAKTVVRGIGDMRVGLAQFNGGEGATILKGLTSIGNEGVRDSIIQEIDKITANGSTPLAEALSDIGRYYIEGYPDQSVTVFRSQPGKEQNISASAILNVEPKYAAGVTKPGAGESASIQQYCQKNFVLALTDGLPNNDSARNQYLRDYDDDGNSADEDALDDVAEALFDVNWRPDLVNPNDPDHKNNIVSYFVGFADPALADNQLLKDAGNQGGGSYQFADSASSLVSSLNDAVNAISNSIGTQASVAFNSTSLDIGSVIYSAKFDTSDFSGRLYARSLNPETGRISTTLWEASEKLSNESSSTREILTYFNGQGVPLTGATSGVDRDPDSPHEGDLNFNDGTGATDGAWTDRLSYLRGDTANDGLNGYRQRGTFSSLLDGFTGPKLLGDIVHSTPIYVGKPELNWPASFGGNNNNEKYEQFKIDNASRTPMVYVGANDGMLHGFNAETGEEVFGYVPSLVLDTARYEGLHSFTSSEYSHNYYVDLTPTISDIYIDPTGANGNQKKWLSVLVGGLRGGGKGYFALNVTDPTKLNEANADNVVMWEFDGAADSANLGHSYSEAQIAKLNNGKWAVIFGNGYNSDNGGAGLFIVYIDAGIDGNWTAGEWKYIPTGEGTDATGRKNGLSSPRLIDLNGDSLVDRVYAGDLMGNMWSFDLSATADTGWGVYGNKPLFSAGGMAGQPAAAIMAAPLVARNTAVSGSGANVLVMFGTGQYLNSGDLSDDTAGGFYAVWDNDYTLGANSVVAADLATRELAFDGTARKVNYDSLNTETLDWTTHQGWKIPLDTGDVDGTGYAGERVISSPTLRRNTLFFSTVSPNPQPCASSGSGYLMSLDFRTGEANDDAVADFNNDGSIDAKDDGYVGMAFNGCVGGSCDGEGGNSGSDPGMPGQSGFIGDVRCTPGSSGDVICDDIDVGDEEREGRLAWEEFSPR